MNGYHVAAPIALLAALLGASYWDQDAQTQEIRWQSDLDAATRVAVDSIRPLLIVFR